MIMKFFIRMGLLSFLLPALSVRAQPATRPAPATPAVQRVPEFAATARIPRELLDQQAGSVVVLPSEPGESRERPGNLSGGAVARLVPELRPLPEGYTLARRPAIMSRKGDAFIATFDAVPGFPAAPPMQLLPNARLGMFESVLAAGNLGRRFALTGRVTEFQGANYLLLEDMKEWIERPAPPPSVAEPSDPGAQAPTAVTPAETRPSTGREPTAEELIQDLLKDRPLRAVAPPREPAATQTAPAEVSTGERTASGTAQENLLWPEETLIYDRLVRLVPTEGSWLMAFEDPGRQPTARPIRVLPNRLLETAIRLTGGGTRGVVLVVSGEVTTYRAGNYLLLRKVLIRHDNGNLR